MLEEIRTPCAAMTWRSRGASDPRWVHVYAPQAARSVKRLDEDKSKMNIGNCQELGKASIKCIEEHGFNRNEPACQKHFDAYKECRKQESKREMKSLFW